MLVCKAGFKFPANVYVYIASIACIYSCCKTNLVLADTLILLIKISILTVTDCIRFDTKQNSHRMNFIGNFCHIFKMKPILEFILLKRESRTVAKHRIKNIGCYLIKIDDALIFKMTDIKI